MGYPDGPIEGLAIEGDFAGIQNFVLRPVPGARGAATRLRGRSLRVAALTQLIAKWIGEHFSGSRLFYHAGGRFLIVSPPCLGWIDRLRELQCALDEWMVSAFSGEVVFHLAGAPFADGRIPVIGLRQTMQTRRQRPLCETTTNAAGWRESEFFRPGKENAFRCSGCTKTSNEKVIDEDEREICPECADDAEIGRRLANLSFPMLSPEGAGPIRFLNQEYGLNEQQSADSETGIPLAAIHWMPKKKQRPLDFEEIAACAVGEREWLGYLRVDADRIGEEFRKLEGNPAKTWGLSHLLQSIFCDAVQALISKEFATIYPVYGGGDDLFVIGPWDRTIAFANRLAADFRSATAGSLTFSGGLALAKPREHILSKSDEAENLLYMAKEKRGRLCALGASITWSDLPNLLKEAQKLTGWHSGGLLKSSFLQDVLELHHRWEKDGGKRHQPLLHYQIERNLGSPAQKDVRHWVRKTFLSPGDSWTHAAFLVRYSMLAKRERSNDKEVSHGS